MTKHNEARQELSNINAPFYKYSYRKLTNYINEAEATEKELEELKRDVKKFFEIAHHYIYMNASRDNEDEAFKLKYKLSKVGNDND